MMCWVWQGQAQSAILPRRAGWVMQSAGDGGVFLVREKEIMSKGAQASEVIHRERNQGDVGIVDVGGCVLKEFVVCCFLVCSEGFSFCN